MIFHANCLRHKKCIVNFSSAEVVQRLIKVINAYHFSHFSLQSVLPKIQTPNNKNSVNPAGILYKSIADCYRPVRVADGPITARYRLIKNASWVITIKVYSITRYTLESREMAMPHPVWNLNSGSLSRATAFPTCAPSKDRLSCASAQSDQSLHRTLCM